MMKQKTRLFVMLVLIALTSVGVYAQKTMDVSKFTRLDNDLMARVTKPVRDNDEGKLCALIRVVTSIPDIEVRADALGVVKEERHNGEIWLYIPYGAKSVSFTHQGYFPLLYQYPIAIDEATVYELRLSSYETATAGVSQNLNTQMFVLTHNPDDAKVLIDDMEVPTEFGVFAAMMSRGEHKYKVSAPQYEEVEGVFELGEQPVRETANLQPLFGTFQLQTQPVSGFDVLINGNKVGTSPYKSERLDPGNYTVRIEKEKFYPKDTLIRLREGDNLQLTCSATSFADSLFFNRVLGGRRISFGVNVGYMFPFVSASSGGAFTGSPVNYSLGNEGENSNYSSQSGFTVGLFADIRLYKNLYLIPGVNYTLYKYKNTFNTPFDNRVVMAGREYVNYATNYQNNYEEKYTHHMLDFTLQASYRFVLTRTSSVHVNAGPYFRHGFAAKLDLSGSSEYNGNVYRLNYDNTIDFNNISGTFSGSEHASGDLNMYKRLQVVTKTKETSGSIGYGWEESNVFDKSPFKRFSYGLKFGVTYELRGFQLSANYALQLSNMANDEFWESTRIPLFVQTGENVMSGYKHRLHALEIKFGYVFRY